MTQSGFGALRASNKASHPPFCASPRKQRQTELYLPNRAGKSAPGSPVRINYTAALKDSRLSFAVTPQPATLPESRGQLPPTAGSLFRGDAYANLFLLKGTSYGVPQS